MDVEEIPNVMLIILTSLGVGFFLVGVLLVFFPPKKINGLYGYRTSRSMQSQEAWDFSQKYSTKIMLILGVVYTSIGLLTLLFPKLDEITASLVSITIILVGVFFMFYKTEKELAKRFDD